MIARYLLMLYLTLLSPVFCNAQPQQGVSLQFIPMAGTKPLVIGAVSYPIGGQDSFRISTFRFYLSNIQFLNRGKLVAAAKQIYHLLDATAPATLEITTGLAPGIVYDAVRFGLGVDSAVNANGAQGGVLDATKGMYWAWQSGYINMKIEGNCPLCNTRKHAFEFHLGGFRGQDYCMQLVTLLVKGEKTINIAVDVLRFLKAVNLSKEAAVMSPGSDAVRLSKAAAQMFYTINPAP